MELRAAIEGLKKLKTYWRWDVTVHSASEYVCNLMSNRKKPKAKLDLIAELDEVAALHDVEWKWVPGHSGSPYNERAHYLALQESKKRRC